MKTAIKFTVKCITGFMIFNFEPENLTEYMFTSIQTGNLVNISFLATVQEWDGSYNIEKDEKEESEMLKSDRNRSISFNAYTN